MGYKSVDCLQLRAAARGEAPVIFGDGKQELDYVYVDDVVDATIRAMESPLDGALLNVGSGVATSINDLTRVMIEVSGNGSRPLGPADWTAGSSRVGDNTLIGKLLDWRPKVSLRDGLQQTYAWMSGRAR